MLRRYAWYRDNAESHAWSVGMKLPNQYGAFDMHGNAWEWCEDTWHDSYEDAPNDGSPWVDGGSPVRVGRGGSFVIPAVYCRSAFRYRGHPEVRNRFLGFRPAFVPSED